MGYLTYIPLVNINSVWKRLDIFGHLHQVYDLTKNILYKSIWFIAKLSECQSPSESFTQSTSKDENAIKAKLRRFCEQKADGTTKCPQWLHEQWKNGDHLNLALQFQSLGFDRVPWPCCCPATVHVYSRSDIAVSTKKPGLQNSPNTCFLPGEVHPLQGENNHEEGYHFKWFGSGMVQQGWYEENLALGTEFWLNNWYLPILLCCYWNSSDFEFSNSMKPIKHNKHNMRWV